MVRFGSGKEQKDVGDLRRSQVITTFGCGSLTDFPRFSGIMAGLEDWKIGLLPDDQRIQERNLEQYLGKEFFIQPSSPSESSLERKAVFGLPTIRFPFYYYCPECHMLDHIAKIGKVKKNNQAFCNRCGDKVSLIPSRFVMACMNGHIEDFPYVWWVHRDKPMCDDPKLVIEYKGTTGGLDSISIQCETCDAQATMEGCMGKEALKGLKCKGRMPWLGKTYIDPEDCNAQLRTLLRGASNVYYSVNQSVLTIPPWSNIVQEAIGGKYYLRLSDIFDEDEEDVKISRLKRFYKKLELDKELYCSEELFVKEAFKRFEGREEEITEKTLVINEYKAFSNIDVDDRYFKTTSEPIPLIFSELIDQVKLVKRLREVQVLRGFRRILPEYEQGTKGLYDRDFTPISKQPQRWLPAVELFGEGIFIKFKESTLREWETRNAGRYIEMVRRLDGRNIGKEMLSPRYVMLHTFSHLLIRQLSFQCGYTCASLKEKIYATYPENDTEMSGILIYTAATDSDGSLGGLVREGRVDRIENTIKAILQEASWCSNDPICIESKAQGMDSLNYASCHACTLLPESSCEARNCLLDRAAITGTPDDHKIGFFDKLL